MSVSHLKAAGPLLALAALVAPAFAQLPPAPPRPPGNPAADGTYLNNTNIIVSIFDTARPLSIVLNTGLSYAAGSLAALSNDNGGTIDFGTVDLSLFGGDFTNVRFTVFGMDGVGQFGSATNGVGVSFSGPLDRGGQDMQNSVVQNLISAANNFYSALAQTCSESNPCVHNAGGGPYAGAMNWSTRFNGASVFGDSSAGIGEALGFYSAIPTSRVATAAANFRQFANAAGVGQWLVDAAGRITYSIPAIPLPAGVWLLLSGLAGFAAISRRRRNHGVAAAGEGAVSAAA